jgi:hypothetical protein
VDHIRRWNGLPLNEDSEEAEKGTGKGAVKGAEKGTEDEPVRVASGGNAVCAREVRGGCCGYCVGELEDTGSSSKLSPANFALLFKSPLLRATLFLIPIWAFIAFASPGVRAVGPTYYEKAKGLVHKDVTKVQAVATAADFMGLVLAALLVDLIGRRWIIVIGFLGAMGSTFVIAGLGAKTVWPLAVAVGMQQLFQAWVWGPLDVLTGELFPTIIRNSGSGLLRTISGISGTCVCEESCVHRLFRCVNGFLRLRCEDHVFTSSIILHTRYTHRYTPFIAIYTPYKHL